MAHHHTIATDFKIPANAINIFKMERSAPLEQLIHLLLVLVEAVQPAPR
jgi:hypothetical protein